MNKVRGWTVVVVVIALALSIGQAWGFDLPSPGKLVSRLLGKGETPPAPPARPAPTPALADTSAAAEEVLQEILLSPEPYYYQSVGRRDPFVSLVGDAYADEYGGELTAKDVFVVGILWGERDRFALVETTEGTSHILREGDTFGPFTVTRIEPDAVNVYVSEYGVGKTIRIGLAEGKGSKNARGER